MSNRPSEMSSSIHGKPDRAAAEMLPRPKTVPNLLPQPRLTKLLLNVTIQRSLGAMRVIMPPEATVEDLIAAALRQQAKEQRFPVLPWRDASDYGLHYTQFSLESLDRNEKLVALGSRSFFLCPRTRAAAAATITGDDTLSVLT